MSAPENPAETQAATLAAALIERIGPLAQAAEHAREGIAADRERFAVNGEADALIDTVVERVDELEADCRRLMRVLVGFEAVAAAPSEPAPAAEAGPAPGPGAQEPGADAAPGQRAPQEPGPRATPVGPAVADEPTPAEEAAGVVSFPGTGQALPESEPPGAEPPIAAMPPPVGAPVDPSADLATGTEEPVAEVGSDPGEPVHISEGVRLLATQMSVAGASSADIARRLNNDFGVEDADRLVAQLFGPGSQVPR